MRFHRFWPANILLPLLIAPLAATPLLALPAEKDEAVTTLARSIVDAVAKGDAVPLEGLSEKLAILREGRDDKTCEPLVKALTKGVGHRNQKIALLCIEGLGTLHCAGSSGPLGPFLTPPLKLTEEQVSLHVAAFRAAGRIHDGKSSGPLLKGVEHPSLRVGHAAASALGGFKTLEAKERLALVRQALPILERLEKRIAAAKAQGAAKPGDEDEREEEDEEEDEGEEEGEEEAQTLQTLHALLNGSMNELARNPTPTTHAQWVAWLKSEAKAPK